MLKEKIMDIHPSWTSSFNLVYISFVKNASVRIYKSLLLVKVSSVRSFLEYSFEPVKKLSGNFKGYTSIDTLIIIIYILQWQRRRVYNIYIIPTGHSWVTRTWLQSRSYIFGSTSVHESTPRWGRIKTGGHLATGNRDDTVIIFSDKPTISPISRSPGRLALWQTRPSSRNR